jgi:hypothetical protein
MRAAVLASVLVLTGLAATAVATAVAAGERPALLRCAFASRDGQPQANCEIGPAADLGRIQHVTWRREGLTGTVDARFTPFSPGGTGVVLFHIDRGDKARGKLVQTIAADLIRLVDSARGVGPAVRTGLAAGSDRFDLLAGLGASRDEVARALTGLRADGAIGDTARLAGQGVALVAAAPETRRLVVVASDGKAEDAAYGSDTLVDLAQDSHVVVSAVIYRGEGEAVGAFGLRRLVEETGGILIETQPGTRLDDAAIARFGQFVRSGGSATFPIDARDPRGRYVVGVELDGGARLSGTFSADLDPVRPIAAVTPVSAIGDRVAPAANAPGLAEGSGLDRAIAFAGRVVTGNPRFLQIAGGIVAAAAVLIALSAWLRRRGIRAWLQIEDDPGTRIPIRANGVRLGRHSDNDIRFSERSVHRYHALLMRDPETQRYVITDVSRDQARSNGVVVNSEIVKRAELAHGDLVELGEVRFRFLYAGKGAKT